ncbi:MAG: putative tRNA sulfurtransferase [Candidatus Malacoplasma girerdii]|nr:MAG: putative tRNA sulfurtransferase [Candidatus Malacoplasma girerdii]
MKKLIYLKYGELTLKGKNRVNFIDCLYRNTIKALSQYNLNIVKHFDCMTIYEIDDKNIESIVTILKRIPGIFKIIIAYEINNNNLSNVGNFVVDLIKEKNFNSFKVETKRHDKSYPINSMDFSKQIGGIILKNIENKQVKMNNFDLLITIEIKEKSAICYFESINGFGGFPVGISGKTLVLISGGIDSPVAASLLMKKGMHIDFLTFITPPHTSDKALEKVKLLTKKITLNCLLDQSKLFVCNITHIQNELAHMKDSSYQITLMRRYFFRIAEYLMNKYKYDAIATGESLGQVASQTIQSMQTIESVLKPGTIVLRPLLSYDKLEIIKLSKEIDTYEISIQPYSDCCSLFVPKQPTTKPTIGKALELEKDLELVNDLYQRTLKKYIKIID